jgi:hypothetical protein
VEDLLKAISGNEGSAGIPKREEAALNLRLQIVQKLTRDGAWMNVGDVMSPLVETDKNGNKSACEQLALELSLGATGLITNSLTGERETVAQATVSARNSKLRYYLGLLLAVAFFGGFLLKSWWEERVFERDTRRLMAYYKHAHPGSMQDGDNHNSRYLVWKYRGKKEKLWRSLEKKYGVEVLHEHEWPEEEEKEEGGEEEENLDEPQATDDAEAGTDEGEL